MRARVLQNPPLEGKAPITTHGPTEKILVLGRTCLHVVQAPRQGPAGPSDACVCLGSYRVGTPAA